MVNKKRMSSDIQQILKTYDTKCHLFQNVEISQLPQYSSWPSRLLGLEKFNKRVKTQKEILREYETEKWGRLLRIYQQGSWKSFLDFRNNIELDHQLTPRSWRDKIFLLDEVKYNKLQADFLADLLANFLPQERIVELGCGFGAMLLDLAGRKNFSQVNWVGGDIAKSGVSLLNKMAVEFDFRAQAYLFDFINFDSDFIPPGTVIFTSFSMSCVDHDLVVILKKIAKAGPRVVIHLEPTYVDENQNDLLALMRKKYIELNGYNGNISAALRILEKQKFVKILFEEKHILGANPLIPVSLIIWEPVVI